MKASRIAAVCVSLVALLAVPRSAFAQDELRIARVSRSVGTDAEVLVSVPRALSGRTLAPSAFTVAVDGSPVPATATRLVGRGFEIALVIETSNSATEELFVAAKAAAVEFILQQPVDTRIALVSSDPPAVTLASTADRAALVGAIKTLSRAPGSGLVAALGLAARLSDATRPVTIIAAATAADATASATALRDEPAASLRTGPSQLFAVGAVSAPLAQLAGDSGGFARTADARQFVGAFDAVSFDLAGRYGLTFPVPPNATRVDVRVSAPEGTATASVALSSGASKSAATAGTAPPAAENGIGAARAADDSKDSLWSARTVALVVIIGLLAAGLIGGFEFRRSRRRSQLRSWLEAVAPTPAALFPVAAPAPAPAPAPSLSPPPPPPPLPTIDLRRPEVPLPLVMAGYTLTALCEDGELAELRAAVEPCGIVVSQAHTVDEAMRAVVTGRAKALYVDGTVSQARELAAAVRQRNDAGWSSCPTLVHDSHQGPPDPALMAVADAFIAAPIDASRVVAALATRGPATDETTR